MIPFTWIGPGQWVIERQARSFHMRPQFTIIQSSRILEAGEDKEKSKDERSVFVCVWGRLEEWEE